MSDRRKPSDQIVRHPARTKPFEGAKADGDLERISAHIKRHPR